MTVLQRMAEVVEFATLLDEACAAPDSRLRLAYVGAFAISAYAGTNDLRTRTNFNPILGETFELHDDKGVSLVAEQVPPPPPPP